MKAFREFRRPWSLVFAAWVGWMLGTLTQEAPLYWAMPCAVAGYVALECLFSKGALRRSAWRGRK